MAQLDEYIKDAEEHNLGKDVTDKAKEEGKKQAKKQLKKMSKDIQDMTGITKLKKKIKAKAKKGIKAGAKAAFGAAKTGISALMATPFGWVVLISGVIIGVVIISKIDDAAQERLIKAVSSEVISSEETGVGVTETLTEDGVAVLMNDCPELKTSSVSIEGVDVDATMEANAKKIYTVFKAYGLNDECIAGMLGNMQVEGSLDPTTVEGVYDEPYQIGPKKQAAVDSLDSYTSGTLFGLYASSGISINQDAYRASDGKYYAGIGLAQWTGPNAYQLLTVGASTGQPWYSMEYQLAYMLSDAHYRPGFFADWKANLSTSVSDGCYHFSEGFEGNTTMAQAERQQNSANWFSKMSSWSVDDTYYQSILNLSKSMGGAAADTAKGEAAKRCKSSTGVYDNSSIASAAVSYAYPTQDQGLGNNGTELYQRVHENIFPGDSYFMSCDRSVACAIRWSGSDDDFPAGPTGDQLAHMISSPKWESLGNAGSLSMDDLQPGDIFCLNGHVFMYTGSEIIQQIHGDKADPSSDSVSGSLDERSPGCGGDSSSIIARGGEDWSGRGQYEVFRCVQPDNSETYKNAGSSSILE